MNIISSKVVAAPEGQAKTLQVTLELTESELDAIIHALLLAYYAGPTFAPWRTATGDLIRLLRMTSIHYL